ncbi:hypothetical protein BKA61DRAFT_585053 [Leptodontidium sp. MPI-SDFR-AT-0119]|nr:hypothetical protein BKA61DRAFT_585053 [Leptodontidium sp. MPI-SDFR-AT-0119]
MVSLRSLLALTTVLALTSASALPSDSAAEIFHASLLARQEPGTPLYACHLACGTAVTLSRGTSPCTDVPFLIKYTDCLACAHPSRFNIWQYYGTTLTAAGSSCGLSTSPIPAVS